MSATLRLRLVSDVDEALSLAHARVVQAAYLVGDGFDAASAHLRCLEVAALLEDCGAQPSAELLGEGATGDPLSLLQAAGEALERIPPGSRPLRLGSVRAELTGAILSLPPQT